MITPNAGDLKALAAVLDVEHPDMEAACRALYEVAWSRMPRWWVLVEHTPDPDLDRWTLHGPYATPVLAVEAMVLHGPYRTALAASDAARGDHVQARILVASTGDSPAETARARAKTAKEKVTDTKRKRIQKLITDWEKGEAARAFQARGTE